MKNNIILIIISSLIISCNETASKQSEINFLTLSVLNSKYENQPLNILLDLNSKRILIYNSKINFLELPPSPNDTIGNILKGKHKINSEIIELSNQEVDNIRIVLSEFKEEDFKTKKQTSYDGIGLKLNFLYNNNTLKTIELINDSTKIQIEFFKAIFNILYDKSNQQTVLYEYYNKEYLN